MRYLAVAFSICLLALAACETVQRAPDPGEDPIGYGEYMYELKCQQCHELYNPREFTMRAHQRAMKRYAPQAGLKREDRPYVLDYLLANAKDAQ
jgi:hypothetical protein